MDKSNLNLDVDIERLISKISEEKKEIERAISEGDNLDIQNSKKIEKLNERVKYLEEMLVLALSQRENHYFQNYSNLSLTISELVRNYKSNNEDRNVHFVFLVFLIFCLICLAISILFQYFYFKQEVGGLLFALMCGFLFLFVVKLEIENFKNKLIDTRKEIIEVFNTPHVSIKVLQKLFPNNYIKVLTVDEIKDLQIIDLNTEDGFNFLLRITK